MGALSSGKYVPFEDMVGGFSTSDGTIDFYLRVQSLVNKHSVVLDLGAGRAGWFEDDKCEIRRTIRALKGKVSKVIAADVDEAVKSNRASDEQVLIKNGVLGLEPGSVDVIVADYVLEHIDDVEGFYCQIDSILKPGGWFCARTPHKYNYISIISRMIKNSQHANVLKSAQPHRKEMDVFPTHYKMNTLGALDSIFRDYEKRSFISRSDPAYFFNNKFIFLVQKIAHGILPKEVSGNIFIFMRKI